MDAHRLISPFHPSQMPDDGSEHQPEDVATARSLADVPVARAILSQPARMAAVFWLAAAAAGISVSIMSEWTGAGRVAIYVMTGLCVVIGVLHLSLGDRLPRWGMHAGGVAALLFISAMVWMGPSGHVDFNDVYLWVVVYAALYFTARQTAAYIAGASLLYGGVLLLGPTTEDPVASWLVVTATAVIVGVVVAGLVAVLRSDARSDALTGLPNRRSWDERLEAELERNRRAGTVLSVAIIDLDNFKAINDRHGHDAGDLVLKRVARSWHGMVRTGGDILARLGGDEFGLLAPGADAVSTRRLAKRLHEVTPDGVEYSYGVATWDGEESATALVRRADQSMFRAKSSQSRGSRARN